MAEGGRGEEGVVEEAHEGEEAGVKQGEGT